MGLRPPNGHGYFADQEDWRDISMPVLVEQTFP